jgi:hypothetical protein
VPNARSVALLLVTADDVSLSLSTHANMGEIKSP